MVILCRGSQVLWWSEGSRPGVLARVGAVQPAGEGAALVEVLHAAGAAVGLLPHARPPLRARPPPLKRRRLHPAVITTVIIACLSRPQFSYSMSMLYIYFGILFRVGVQYSGFYYQK